VYSHRLCRRMATVHKSMCCSVTEVDLTNEICIDLETNDVKDMSVALQTERLFKPVLKLYPSSPLPVPQSHLESDGIVIGRIPARVSEQRRKFAKQKTATRQ